MYLLILTGIGFVTPIKYLPGMN